MHRVFENFLNADALRESEQLLKIGLFNTLKLAGLSFLTSLLLGLVVAYARTRGNRIARNGAIAVIDIIRAMPPLVTLMLAAFLLPSIIHIQLSSFSAAVITFALIHGAYVGEVYRGGIMALDKGQIEAARAAGLSRWKANRLVFAPLVLGVIVPPLTNEIIFVVRNSSLAYFIGYNELLLSATRAVALTSNESPITMAALLYAIILLILQGVSALVERKMGYASEARVVRRARWGFFRRPTTLPSEVSR
jgi:His/Glu/Gln/Arg/opine family amino acid ABC transporter permease subunit